ncbi:MAG: hypothetical protein CV087_03755 [Candidatus Brocadia sp. WS118]|nr:MAG: hypothetical protein CV087_03755 [Candidatus Brocadia sp. WS118]
MRVKVCSVAHFRLQIKPISRRSAWGHFALFAALASTGCATSVRSIPTTVANPSPAPVAVVNDLEDKNKAVRVDRTTAERHENSAATAPAPRVTIRSPGPDLSNLPNSSYTLPKGGVYVEMLPLALQGTSNSPKLYNCGILLRYGLTNFMELQMYTLGFSVQGQPQSTTGFSPLTFDTRIHLAEDAWRYFNYSLGLEAYVQTTWGSEAFDSGTQYALTMNVDHALPCDVALNWNLGFVVMDDPTGEEVVEPSFLWALQRDVINDLAVFIQGYINNESLPSSRPDGKTTAKDVTEYAVGAGFQWTLNDRIALFGSYNVGLNQFTPDYAGSLGFAVAF